MKLYPARSAVDRVPALLGSRNGEDISRARGHPFATFMSTLSYGIRDPLLSNHRDSLLYSIPGISLLVLCI